MSKPTDFDEEVLAIVEDVGASLDQLADLDDDQREEMGALMETLGYDEAANIVRPSRRGLLKSGATGAAALATAGLVGTAATDRAAAGTQSSGTWGGPSDVQDFYVEDVYDSGDNNPMSFPGDGSVSIDDMSITNLGTRAYLGADQTVTSGSYTKVQFDTTSFDDKSEFDTTNYKFVASNAGRYSIQSAVRWNDVSTGQRSYITIYKNGARILLEEYYIHSSSYQSTSISDVRDLASGDEIDIRVYLRSVDETIFGDVDSYLNVSKEG
jgi:hypothetical protein